MPLQQAIFNFASPTLSRVRVILEKNVAASFLAMTPTDLTQWFITPENRNPTGFQILLPAAPDVIGLEWDFHISEVPSDAIVTIGDIVVPAGAPVAGSYRIAGGQTLPVVF